MQRTIVPICTHRRCHCHCVVVVVVVVVVITYNLTDHNGQADTPLMK